MSARTTPVEPLTPAMLDDMRRRVQVAREHRENGITVGHITLEQAEALLAVVGDWEPLYAAPDELRCDAHSGDQCVHYADARHDHEADTRHLGGDAPVVAHRLQVEIVSPAPVDHAFDEAR